MISIPEYFERYIDKGVDLRRTTKLCCPFHAEDRPSFSYSPEKGVWRCFGSCKAGGDVIALHQKNYRLRTRKEAEDSLYKLLGIYVATTPTTVKRGTADKNAAAYKAAYAKAVMSAVTVEDWEELDYIMGQHPCAVSKLEAFYNCRRG